MTTYAKSLKALRAALPEDVEVKLVQALDTDFGGLGAETPEQRLIVLALGQTSFEVEPMNGGMANTAEWNVYCYGATTARADQLADSVERRLARASFRTYRLGDDPAAVYLYRSTVLARITF